MLKKKPKTKQKQETNKKNKKRQQTLMHIKMESVLDCN